MKAAIVVLTWWAGALACASVTAAQEMVDGTTPTHQIVVDGVNGKFMVDRSASNIAMEDTLTIDRDSALTIQVRCEGGAVGTVCPDALQLLTWSMSGVSATSRKPISGGTDHEVAFTILGKEILAGHILRAQLTRIGTAAAVTEFFVRLPAEASPPAGEAADVPVKQLLARNCLVEARQQVTDWKTATDLSAPGLYSRQANTAHFLVTPLGNVVYRSPSVIDENDMVVVDVLADTRLFPHLQVVRTSTIRDVSEQNIIGSAVSIGGVVERENAGTPAREPQACAIVPYSLADFSPGEGKFTLTTGDNDETRTSNDITFAVDRLYAGALSFGPMLSYLGERTYTLDNRGADTVVAYARNGRARLHYAVLFTPFVWGRRDLEKRFSDVHPLIAHVNPSLGMVVDDISHNGVAGVTVDFASTLFLTYGMHVGRVHQLDDGLEVGDQFHGSENALPTSDRWSARPFWAATVDLRAAAQLVTGALSALASAE